MVVNIKIGVGGGGSRSQNMRLKFLQSNCGVLYTYTIRTDLTIVPSETPLDTIHHCVHCCSGLSTTMVHRKLYVLIYKDTHARSLYFDVRNMRTIIIRPPLLVIGKSDGLPPAAH